MNAIKNLSLLLIGCALIFGSAPSPSSGAEPSLRFRLITRDSYLAGHPVAITFTLENASPERVWVLKWYTPLEGIRGKILRVTRDGKELPYRGPLVKRGAPGRDSYVVIDVGKAVSAEFDLSKSYDISVVGTYRVEFVGRIHDVAWDGETLWHRSEAKHPMEASGESVTFHVTTP